MSGAPASRRRSSYRARGYLVRFGVPRRECEWPPMSPAGPPGVLDWRSITPGGPPGVLDWRSIAPGGPPGVLDWRSIAPGGPPGVLDWRSIAPGGPPGVFDWRSIAPAAPLGVPEGWPSDSPRRPPSLRSDPASAGSWGMGLRR